MTGHEIKQIEIDEAIDEIIAIRATLDRRANQSIVLANAEQKMGSHEYDGFLECAALALWAVIRFTR